MLYAELFGKAPLDATDIKVREDVLTSTVFGTLIVAGAWDVLSQWFRCAVHVGAANEPFALETNAPREYWFWPRLGGTEPDVLLRLGGTLVIVEAKYLSSKSGSATPVEAETPRDQLVREWMACSPGEQGMQTPATLRSAIAACTTRRLIYLVQRRRREAETKEARASLAIAPAMSLYMLTWEDLDGVLRARSEPAWVAELRDYLRERSLAAFGGFATSMRVQMGLDLERWRSTERREHSALRAAFRSNQVPLLVRLAAHAVGRTERRRWARITTAASLPGLHALATWGLRQMKGNRPWLNR